MPLAGFICELTDEEVSFEECLSCAEERHPCKFVPEVLRAMAQNPEQRKDAGISITTTLGCLRQGFLSLSQPYHQYPHQLWPALRGTTLHMIGEQYPSPNALYEVRFARQLPAGTLTGKMDKVVPDERLIVDWKTKDKLPKAPPEDYVWQLNGYRLILADAIVVSPGVIGQGLQDRGLTFEAGEKVSLEIERLGLFFMTMGTVNKYPVPAMELEQVSDYFCYRVEALQTALDGGPVPDRQVADPTASRFCGDWCPHLSICTRA